MAPGKMPGLDDQVESFEAQLPKRKASTMQGELTFYRRRDGRQGSRAKVTTGIETGAASEAGESGQSKITQVLAPLVQVTSPPARTTKVHTLCSKEEGSKDFGSASNSPVPKKARTPVVSFDFKRSVAGAASSKNSECQKVSPSHAKNNFVGTKSGKNNEKVTAIRALVDSKKFSGGDKAGKDGEMEASVTSFDWKTFSGGPRASKVNENSKKVVAGPKAVTSFSSNNSLVGPKAEKELEKSKASLDSKSSVGAPPVKDPKKVKTSVMLVNQKKGITQKQGSEGLDASTKEEAENDSEHEDDDDSPSNETRALVRSKRGRAQALPSRFRDSVVTPLTKGGPKGSRHSPEDSEAPLSSIATMRLPLANPKKCIKLSVGNSSAPRASIEPESKRRRCQGDKSDKGDLSSESLNSEATAEDHDRTEVSLHQSPRAVDMDGTPDAEVRGTVTVTVPDVHSLEGFDLGEIVWAKSGKRNDPVWPAKVIDPIREAPGLVRKLSLPNRLCVMFYGPSLSKGKQRVCTKALAFCKG